MNATDNPVFVETLAKAHYESVRQDHMAPFDEVTTHPNGGDPRAGYIAEAERYATAYPAIQGQVLSEFTTDQHDTMPMIVEQALGVIEAELGGRIESLRNVILGAIIVAEENGEKQGMTEARRIVTSDLVTRQLCTRLGIAALTTQVSALSEGLREALVVDQ